MAGTPPVTMPTWQQLLVPVLEILRDGQTRRLRDLYGLVADHVGPPTSSGPTCYSRRDDAGFVGSATGRLRTQDSRPG